MQPSSARITKYQNASTPSSLAYVSWLRLTGRSVTRTSSISLLPDGAQIELFSFANAPARRSYPEACGLRHLAFEVNNVDLCKAELESRGICVDPVRTDEYTNRRFVFFTDPDGLPLALYEVPRDEERSGR